MKCHRNSLEDMGQCCFSQILDISIWWRYGGHFPLFVCSTLTVVILVQFHLKFRNDVAYWYPVFAIKIQQNLGFIYIMIARTVSYQLVSYYGRLCIHKIVITILRFFYSLSFYSMVPINTLRDRGYFQRKIAYSLDHSPFCRVPAFVVHRQHKTTNKHLMTVQLLLDSFKTEFRQNRIIRTQLLFE